MKLSDIFQTGVIFSQILILAFVTFAYGQNKEIQSPKAATQGFRMERPRDPQGWYLSSQSKNYKVFRKQNGDDLHKNQVLFKVEATFEFSPRLLVQILFDVKNQKRWTPHLEDQRSLVDPKNGTRFFYFRMKMPFIIKDRDFLTNMSAQVDSDGKKLILTTRSATDQESIRMDAPVNSKVVRGYVRQMVYEISEGRTPGTTQVLAYIQVDAGGSVPQWIIDLFAGDWPSETFERMNKYACQIQAGEFPEPRLDPDDEIVLTDWKL